MSEFEEIRTEEPSGEDMLLQQIDAFRDKAKQLQGLIAAKEDRVVELENLVNEKEQKNAELQQELAEKQMEADGLVTDVEKQVDRMMASLQKSMDDLEDRIQMQVSNNQQQSAEQTQNMKDNLQEMSEGLEEIKGELSEKVHSESVLQYRNIQDLLKEYDNSEEEEENTELRFAKINRDVTGVTALSVINMIVSGTAVVLLLLMMFV